MLRYSLKLETEAQKAESAVEAVLAAGYRTRDLAGPGEKALNTAEMTTAIIEMM